MIAVKGIKYATAARFGKATKLSESDDDAAIIICPQRLSPLSKASPISQGLKNATQPSSNPGNKDCGGTDTCSVPVLGEDCLRLSIFSPSAEGSRAVLVWVPGGAFIKGSGLFDRYDGTILSQNADIVVVCVSYRVGVFGFFPGTGNPGLGDIVCALDWIRENISRYGGDPGRICVCGQSAGAYCIANLISASTRPLFRNAILLSPPLGMSPLRTTKLKRLIIKNLDNRGVDIHSASSEVLLECQEEALKEIGGSAMPFCTENCPRFPSRKVMPDLRNVLVCTEANDASPFVPAVLEGLATKLIFELPARRFVTVLRDRGVAASLEKLSWVPGSSRLKACHTLEVSLLLGSWEDWHTADMLEGADKEEWERQSGIFKSRIASFTKL